MKLPYFIILLIAFALNIAVFVHEQLYDTPQLTYTTADYITDFILGSILFTTIFWAVLSAIYMALRWVATQVRNKVKIYL